MKAQVKLLSQEDLPHVPNKFQRYHSREAETLCNSLGARDAFFPTLSPPPPHPINDGHWTSGGQLHQSGPVFSSSNPQNCPIRGIIDLYELHVWNSAHVIYHIMLIQKSWTEQNFRSPTPSQTPVSLAHWC